MSDLEECEVENCTKKRHIFSEKYCGYHRGQSLSGTEKQDMANPEEIPRP